MGINLLVKNPLRLAKIITVRTSPKEQLKVVRCMNLTKNFVTSQLDKITNQLSTLMSIITFSQERIVAMEKALNIKVITPTDAESYNNSLPDDASAADEKIAHIDTTECATALQKKTNEELVLICHKQQLRISSFTAAINELSNTCADFQQVLLNKGLLSEHDTRTFALITKTLDNYIESRLNGFLN